MKNIYCGACTLNRRWVKYLFAAATVTLNLGMAEAQEYPAKPVRIITAEAGGGNDFVARLITPALSAGLGQQVIVDNRTGIISGESVSKAPPDGYTLLLSGSTFWVSPLLRDNVPYDPVRDFAPVTQATSSPNILVIHPSLPVKTVRELIALAKSRPGELNYASASTGSPPHLAAELFKSMAGVNIVRINYKGTGPALNALFGGQVQLMITPSGAVAPHVKSGRLKALAVTGMQPSTLAPGLPTVAAAVPGYEVVSIIGLFAPARTPDSVIHRLNQEAVRVLNRSDVKERFLAAGAEPVGSSPEKFAAAVKSEIAKWGKLIKEAGIREE